MLQFDTATVVTSNRFSVNRQAVSSHNREMLGDMRDTRHRRCARAGRWDIAPAEFGRTMGPRALAGGRADVPPFRVVEPRSDPGPCYGSTFAAGQPKKRQAERQLSI
jgi:hypothetical protein